MKRTAIAALMLSLLIGSCAVDSTTLFKDIMGFPPTADVRNLHTYSEIGIDASYWLAFNCHDSTADKMVTDLKLAEAKEATVGLWGGGTNQPTPWWDTSFVRHTRPFFKKENGIYWYLWHDTTAQKVYLLTYDL